MKKPSEKELMEVLDERLTEFEKQKLLKQQLPPLEPNYRYQLSVKYENAVHKGVLIDTETGERMDNSDINKYIMLGKAVENVFQCFKTN